MLFVINYYFFFATQKQLQVLLTTVAYCLAFGTILVKVGRVYHIFHNPTEKKKVSNTQIAYESKIITTKYDKQLWNLIPFIYMARTYTVTNFTPPYNLFYMSVTHTIVVFVLFLSSSIYNG